MDHQLQDILAQYGIYAVFALCTVEGDLTDKERFALLDGLQVDQGKLDELNRKLGSWEQVKYFRLLPRELSEADGELTPTLKVKRKVVSERYRALIDSMYEDKPGAGAKDAD